MLTVLYAVFFRIFFLIMRFTGKLVVFGLLCIFSYGKYTLKNDM